MVKQVLIDVAKSLVANPDEVVVNERTEGEYLHLELSVAPEDMGKVIGKQGRIAKAIRTLINAAATKENKKVMVDIL